MIRKKSASAVALLAALSFGSAMLVAQDKAPAPKPDAEGFITLFDGSSLEGWKANEKPGTFDLKGGELIVHGPRSHLFYVGPVKDHQFKNFHLRVEALTKPGANSGIYFHTKYQDEGWPSLGFECQVNQTHKDHKKTGGLYAVKDVMDQSPVKDDEWYTYDIEVRDKHVTIAINGKVTSDWTQPDDWTPPKGMEGRKIGSGTFAIQGHDPGSEVHYRLVKVRPLD